MLVKLNKKEWKTFRIYDVFNHVRGKRQVEISRKKGQIPYYSASQSNNGLTDFISNPKFTIDSQAIIYSTFGDSYYVNKNFSASDEITILTTPKLSQNNSLFLCRAINQNKSKYSFGRKAFSNKIGKDNILLPVHEDTIDWKYMEDYSESIIERKRDRYKKHIKLKLNNLKFKKIERIQDKQWKEFSLTDIFSFIQRGKRLTKVNQTKGYRPYISSTASNNGVDNFLSNDSKVRVFSNCITIANSGSVGASFYHPYEFVASDHVTHLKNGKLNEYIYLFISTMTNRFSEKYNFNREINDFRISREKILLPVNEENKPDYKFMEQYIINLKYKKIKQYLNFLESKKNSK